MQRVSRCEQTRFSSPLISVRGSNGGLVDFAFLCGDDDELVRAWVPWRERCVQASEVRGAGER